MPVVEHSEMISASGIQRVPINESRPKGNGGPEETTWKWRTDLYVKFLTLEEGGGSSPLTV